MGRGGGAGGRERRKTWGNGPIPRIKLLPTRPPVRVHGDTRGHTRATSQVRGGQEGAPQSPSPAAFLLGRPFSISPSFAVPRLAAPSSEFLSLSSRFWRPLLTLGLGLSSLLLPRFLHLRPPFLGLSISPAPQPNHVLLPRRPPEPQGDRKEERGSEWAPALLGGLGPCCVPVWAVGGQGSQATRTKAQPREES